MDYRTPLECLVTGIVPEPLKIENAVCFLLFFFFFLPIKKSVSRSTDRSKLLALSFSVGKSTINQTRIILCMFLFSRRLQGLNLMT